MAGLLWDNVSHAAPFALSALLMGLSAMALLITGPWFDRQAAARLQPLPSHEGSRS
jgi:dipeptide/tripeptide permease